MSRPVAPQLMMTLALFSALWIANVHAQEAGRPPPPPDRPPPGFPPPPPPPLPPPPHARAGMPSAPASASDFPAAVDTELEAGHASVDAARRNADGNSLAAELLHLAMLLEARGRSRETLPLLEEAVGLSDRAQDERMAQQAATLLAAAHGKTGDSERAAFWRERADLYRDRFSARLLRSGSTAAQSPPAHDAPTEAAIPAPINNTGALAPAPSADRGPGKPEFSRWPWFLAALSGVLLFAWWRTRSRAAALEETALQLQRRQQRTQTINARLQAESDQLRKQAVQDTLTGALTRHAFASSLRELLVHASHYGRPVALLVMDLDHFKSINDQFGHLSGDAALKLVVGIARENLGSGDLLGRFGGDEFLIAAIDHDAMMALALGESIRKSVAQRAGATHALAQLRVSVGIAHATPASGYDLEHLFHRADAALYAAKRSGRDRVAIESEHDPAPSDQPLLRQLSTSAAEGDAAGTVAT